MKRQDQVWKTYQRNSVGLRRGCQKAARAVVREFEEMTHDVLWGLKPSDFYTGKVIRRRVAA